MGAYGTDIDQQFDAWRYFGFKELLKGKIALWNPHIFGGAPYHGGFQSALLYPPNLVYLMMSAKMATSWIIVMHLCISGVAIYVWGVKRYDNKRAAFLGGLTMMFGGALYSHVYAGHLSNICAMAWTPAILLYIESMLHEEKQLSIGKSTCILSAFISLQILSGHPQYVYFTAISAFLYLAISCTLNLYSSWRVAMLTITSYLFSLAIAAAQFLPGIQANAETIRSHGLSYEMASMFYFPLENILTLVMPNIYGNMDVKSYVGRWYLWEMNLYIGAAATLLVILGMLKNYNNKLNAPAIITIVIVALISIGATTPLYRYLYEYMPGVDKFRGVSKALFTITPFLAAYVVVGYCIIDSKRESMMGKISIAVLCLGILTYAASFDKSIVERISVSFKESGQSYFFEASRIKSDENEGHAKSIEMISNHLENSGRYLVLIAMLLILTSRIKSTKTRSWIYILAASGELMVYAVTNTASHLSDDGRMNGIEKFLRENPGDYRVFNRLNSNSAMIIGARDISGNDPGVTIRYAQLLAYAEGKQIGQANQYIGYKKNSQAYDLIGLKYIFGSDAEGGTYVQQVTDRQHPRISVVGNYLVEEQAEKILELIAGPKPLATGTIVLEHKPDMGQMGEPVAHAQVIYEDSDEIQIEIDTDRKALLIMTDSYASSWKAKILHEEKTKIVGVKPANYAFRVVELEGGHSIVTMYYDRTPLHVGAAISIISVLIWIGIFKHKYIAKKQSS